MHRSRALVLDFDGTILDSEWPIFQATNDLYAEFGMDAVPLDGCTVSVAEHHGGAGWCFTLDAGLHNLPDDEMSWFSIPGTGCNRY